MAYSSEAIREAYDKVAEEENRAEKKPSLRTEITREFIKKYLKHPMSFLMQEAAQGLTR